MSEEAKVTTEDTKTTAENSAQQEQKDEKYKIEVASHEPFNAIVSAVYVNSSALCKLVSDLFKASFADCYGSTFDLIPGTQNYTISLYFDHDDHGNAVVATSKEDSNDSTVNSTLRRTRNFSRRILDGDRYNATKEAIEALTPFMFGPEVIGHIYKNSNNRHGFNSREINWKNVVSETADSSYGYNGIPRQLTKISFLDPDKLIAAIFGSVSDEGEKYVYTSRILRSMPAFGGGNADYKLVIQRLAEHNVIDLANQFGLGYQAGLNIIR